MKFEVIKAPEQIPHDTNHIKVFLGGSIEMGKAEDWQTRLTKDLSENEDMMILNPRRDDWDSSWIQDPTSGTKFHEQVSWELNAQDNADLIVYYFADDTNSPITLLELGLYAAQHGEISEDTGGLKYVVVRCSPKFYRYGNVKMVCDKYGIPVVETYDELLEYLS